MYKSNILVLVYENELYNAVIWDDNEKKKLTEITFKED